MADDRFDPDVKKSKGGFNAKVFVIGIPLFIIQLVGVYFIVGYILQQKMGVTQHIDEPTKTEHVSEENEEIGPSDTTKIANFLFSVDDLLLNPAGTNGQVIMLVSISLGINSQQAFDLLKSKEIIVRDLIINTLSEKGLEELKIENRDNLRTELATKVGELFSNIKIINVYFSKFILQ